MLLSTAEIADMRATALEFLDSTGVIYTRSLVSDGEGGKGELFTEGATVDCRLEFRTGKPSSKDALEGGRTAQAEEWDLSLSFDTAIGEADRIAVTTPQGYAGLFSVISPTNERSWAAVKRLKAKRIAGPPAPAEETSVYPGAIDDFTD